jgi:uncharacterized delta-60 repeat protein
MMNKSALIICQFILLLAGLAVLPAKGQSPVVDGNFNPNVTSSVWSIGVQADGKIVAGGRFTQANGQSYRGLARFHSNGTLDTLFSNSFRGNIINLLLLENHKILVNGPFRITNQPLMQLARLNTDGTLDITFQPITNFGVGAVSVQLDGKILVGGSFTNISGVSRHNLARLNTDGTVDPNFNPSTDDSIVAIALQQDQKILVGGTFTNIMGQQRSVLARLHPDGTLDSAFNAGITGIVVSLVVQPDGRILAGGAFTNSVGTQHSYVRRFNTDGSTDPSFSPYTNEFVHAVALQADGKILIAEAGNGPLAQNPSHLVRLNRDGTPDPTFDQTASNRVYALCIEQNGNILVGGEFTALGSEPRKYVGRLHSTGPALQELAYDGSTISWLRGGNSPEFYRTAFEVFSPENTWTNLGEGTPTAGGWQRTGTVDLDRSTVRARGFITGGFRNGSGGIVEAYLGKPTIELQAYRQTNNPGTTVAFRASVVGSEPISFHWLKDGKALQDMANVAGAKSLDLSLSNVFGMASGVYAFVASNNFGMSTATVATLTVLDPLIVHQPVTQLRNRGEDVQLSIAVTGSSPITYQWWKNGGALSGIQTNILALGNVQITNSGNYFVVVSNGYGAVTSAVAQLIVNEAVAEPTFKPAMDGYDSALVFALALQPDERILVGGSFHWLNGVVRENLGRLNPDGTLDTTFDPAPNGWVYCTAIQEDGKIIIGGDFTNVGAHVRAGLCRLNPNGTVDEEFNPGTSNSVWVLAMQRDGKVLVGGDFTSLGGRPRKAFGRLHPSGMLDEDFNPEISGSIACVVVQADGKIVIGGSFTNISGHAHGNIARLHVNGTVDATFEANTDKAVDVLTVQTDGRILAGGIFTTLSAQPRHFLGRINSDGTIDPSFNPGATGGAVFSLCLQANGKILVGGYFTNLAGVTRRGLGRLHADGTLDDGFNFVTNLAVRSLALQPDGKLLIGSYFWFEGGDQRHVLGRLISPEPATQGLSYDGSVVRWLRGGSSPELWRATFDYSVDGVSWTNLGSGIHIQGGWQLEGVHLQTAGLLRARGFTAGGHVNASGGLIETRAGPPELSYERREQTVQLSWPVFAGRVELFTSTNLLIPGDWQSVPVEFSSNGSYHVDLQTINAARFFQLRPVQ